MEECERGLHLLWDTFLSLSTHHTSIGHQLDQLLRTTTSPQPFKLVESISPGGVHSTSTGRVNSGRLLLYNVFSITIPPPEVSQYNQPCLQLHTGLRIGPWAPYNHRKQLLVRGTGPQPRTPENRCEMETGDLYRMGFQHRYEMF